jgi:hypothetical protein
MRLNPARQWVAVVPRHHARQHVVEPGRLHDGPIVGSRFGGEVPISASRARQFSASARPATAAGSGAHMPA